MLFPIVGRELRVSARQRGIYWTRLAIALVAILIGTGIFVVTLGLTAAQTGRHIFECLAGLQFIYCLAYGRRSTADCLSQEKREGTLGLLFLTDLKGHDVVLGKLAATSLKGFYGLLAVFPVLAVPLLLGGTTNGEFWRMVLVLVNTFLFSLAVGVFGSALSRDFRRAMAANLLLLLLLVAVPPAVALTMAYFSGRPLIPELFFSCPAYSFYLCADKQYSMEADHFWSSVGIVHGLTWLLVLLGQRNGAAFLARPTIPRGKEWLERILAGMEFWRSFQTESVPQAVAGHQCLLLAGCPGTAQTGARLDFPGVHGGLVARGMDDLRRDLVRFNNHRAHGPDAELHDEGLGGYCGRPATGR